MTGWALFFVLLGTSCSTTLLFRVLDIIEQPPVQHSRRSAVR
jgi:hypothetical protein